VEAGELRDEVQAEAEEATPLFRSLLGRVRSTA
jgi:hypothetical protein